MKPTLRAHLVCGLVSVAALAWSPASANPAAPPHIQKEVPDAQLAGEGPFRWFGLKLYDAQLWTGARGYRSDAAFALDLRYARALKGGRIASASRDEMQKLDAGTPQQRTAWLAQMERLFPDVEVGTHITGVYLADQGVRFYLDGRPLGLIADPAFARAFFAIWLDPRTTAPELRALLLGMPAS